MSQDVHTDDSRADPCPLLRTLADYAGVARRKLQSSTFHNQRKRKESVADALFKLSVDKL